MAAISGNAGSANGDKEIQLIDIVAILLKRRSLILGLLVLGLAWSLGSAVLAGLSDTPETVGVVDSVLVIRANPSIKFLSGVGLDDITLAFLRDPRFIADVLNASGYTELNGESITDLDVQGLIKFVSAKLLNVPNSSDKTSRSLLVVKKATGNIELSFLMDNNLDASRFYDALLTSLNAKLREWVMPIAQAELDSFHQYAAFEYPRQVIEQDLHELFSSYNSARTFMAGIDPVYIKLNEPAAIPYESELSVPFITVVVKDALIKVIAFLVAGIMLAFMLEWVDGIKHNETSMEKLRAALQKPKRATRSGS